MKKALTIKKENGLQEMVDREATNRAILTRFISDHMKRGVDYGSIKINGKESKDCLFKPGAEKIGSLLRLRPDVMKDADTWEMAGSKPGLFCYKCVLYNTKNEVVGMGLGACNISEKQGNYNNSIKIAKKRAYVDAILTTGALSDFFTQDLEDMQQEPLLTPHEMAQKATYTDESGLVHEPVESAVEDSTVAPAPAKVQTFKCERCGAPAFEKAGIAKSGRRWRGIFCSTDDRTHTKFLYGD